MTYTITLPNVSETEAVVVDRALRGLNGVDYVDVDASAEIATVNATLTYGEVLDAIRQAGVAAR